MLKECKYHGLTEYIEDSNGFLRCKKCLVEIVANKRRRNKITLIEYKGGKCQKCGYDKYLEYPEVFEFHHRNPNEKEFGLSNFSSHSLEKLKREISKCDLLCANCHREIHADLKRDKIKEHNREIIIDEKKLNQIKELSKTKAIYEIAEELNLPRTTIASAVKRNNIKVHKKDNPLKNYTVELFLKQYKEKGSLYQVGKLNKVSDNSIRKWLKKNNLPTKREDLQKLIEK